MDSLPPELHSVIIELACALPFGGHSIRAMSLTSTYFHAVTAPFLFHTLAVSSQEQAEHLITLLERSPEPKRHIRRLFLGPALGLAPASALRLLHLAAPTLRDLAAILTSSSSALLGAIFRAPFPNLKALAVRGFYPLPRPGAFPALTHLHLAGNGSPVGLSAALARACPGLRHLRVSGLRSAPAFARELRDALEADTQDAVESIFPFPPHLERVSLEAQTRRHAKTNKVVELRDVQMRQTLLALEQAVGKRKGVPHVEFSDGNADEVDVHKLKIPWLGVSCP
ncbi:hypothetical protein MVEN_00925700 [Mycena venus]|uniref:Uncharacterized protein n=1 Tax=Mycena venus TaxID=2733690 RepID=A0A8H7D260_9AGAR|nr:hypothetical protein MVEN_00925700 [Mycena venus]